MSQQYPPALNQRFRFSNRFACLHASVAQHSLSQSDEKGLFKGTLIRSKTANEQVVGRCLNPRKRSFVRSALIRRSKQSENSFGKVKCDEGVNPE
jgi:hypothetical protein